MPFPLPEMLSLGFSHSWLFAMISDISFKCYLSEAALPEPLPKEILYHVILFYFAFIDYFLSLKDFSTKVETLSIIFTTRNLFTAATLHMYLNECISLLSSKPVFGLQLASFPENPHSVLLL